VLPFCVRNNAPERAICAPVNFYRSNPTPTKPDDFRRLHHELSVSMARRALGISIPANEPVPNSLRCHSHVARRDLVLVRREGTEDFSLLARRHFEGVKGAPELGRDLVKFFG
jgi:hypothetical protein